MQNSQRSSPARVCASGVDARLEDDLGDAAAVAQVDEHAAAVVAAGGHPPEQHDAFADVGRARRRAAVVGTLQICKELGHGWEGIREGATTPLLS